jgi:GT2 family glycosyltransferase
MSRNADGALGLMKESDERPGRGGGTLPKASVIIVNTNERHHLERCLPTVCQQDYEDYEVLVVDNHSTDGSIDFVERHYPQVRVIENSRNLGYAGANNVGFRHACGKYIAVLNADTRVEVDWLRELVHALQAEPGAGLAAPKILMMEDPKRINACGNEITYTGLTFCRGLDQPADDYQLPNTVPAVSGASFVIRRKVLDEVGGFDERFFIYYEETDLSLRAMLAGWYCLFVPSAIVYHEYTFKFSPKKGFLQERNRYFSLLKTLRWRTLIVLVPAFLLAEVLAWGYSILRGFEHVQKKFLAYLWLLRNPRRILEARREVQKLRRVKDRALLAHFSHKLTFAQTTSPELARFLEALLNPLLMLYGGLARRIVTW